MISTNPGAPYAPGYGFILLAQVVNSPQIYLNVEALTNFSGLFFALQAVALNTATHAKSMKI